MRFLIFFVILPATELWLLIEIGSRIGVLSTIGLLFLSAVVGIKLLQQQGFSTLLKMNRKMAAGESPAQEALEGILLAMGGALFLLPGFISDSIGLICLFPPTRHAIVRIWLKRMADRNFVHVHVNTQQTDQQKNVYEGEFRREVPEEKRLD